MHMCIYIYIYICYWHGRRLRHPLEVLEDIRDLRGGEVTVD